MGDWNRVLREMGTPMWNRGRRGMWGSSWRAQEENKSNSCALKGPETVHLRAVRPGRLSSKLSLPKHRFPQLTRQGPLGEMADSTFGARKEQPEPGDHLIVPERIEVLRD